jgi:hypothetical protein
VEVNMSISKMIAKIVYPVIESVLDMYFSDRSGSAEMEIHPGDSMKYEEK